MKILHLVPSVGPASYGLGQVALNLANAQKAAGLDPMIWCLDPQDVCEEVASQLQMPPRMIRGFTPTGPRLFSWSRSMFRAADQENHLFKVVHQHGIWTGISVVTNLLRQHHQIPTVLAPHGALEPKALLKSWWKKKLALLGYESNNLRGAFCLHATALGEMADFRAFGLNNPVALIPNGISREWTESSGDASEFRREFHIPNGRRILLFMSRIAPKKGLPLLLRAWAALNKAFPDWILIIVGGDEDGHLTQVTTLIEKLGLEADVILTGPIFNNHKRNAFEAAELFILPSLSEGFPMVVLDAMGAGVPAIVTHACEWKAIESSQCGWWVEADVDAIKKALSEGLSLPSERLAEMGRVSRRLVKEDYDWIKIAKMTYGVYSWLTIGKTTPNFMHFE